MMERSQVMLLEIILATLWDAMIFPMKITVFRNIPDGGTITLTDGSTTYANCAGNIVFDVMHTTSATELSYWYIITDDNDNILAFQNSTAGSTLDLSGAPAGECHVWGWSYQGLPNPVVGDHISTLADDACEDISDEFYYSFSERHQMEEQWTLTDGSTTYANCAGNIVFDVMHHDYGTELELLVRDYR